MDLSKYHNIYFMGIGGSRMSGLAQMFKRLGYNISGSEMEEKDENKKLRKYGIEVLTPQIKTNIDFILKNNIQLVVKNQAIPDTNEELIEIRRRNIPVIDDPVLIGELTQKLKTIGIAGTQGKTTTTGITAKLLIDNLYDPWVIIGAEATFLDNQNFRIGNENGYLVIEACEYKDAFLNYKFEHLLIPSITYDHHDYFKTHEQYLISFAKAILNTKETVSMNLQEENSIKVLEIAKQISNNKLPKIYDWSKYTEKVKAFNLYIPTDFLIEDSAVVACFADNFGIPKDKTQKSIESYRGIGKRFELIRTLFLNKHKTKIFRDYAHTPEKIHYCLKASHDVFPKGKRLHIIELHQYNRVISLFDKFIDSFITSTDENDILFFTDIFRSRDTDESLKIMNIQKFIEKLKEGKPSLDMKYVGTIENASKEMNEYILKNKVECVILIGAGKIDNILIAPAIGGPD